jgi:mycofactocin precursor
MIRYYADSDDENIAEVDELLVEEVSIDGICGVY